jgi:orotate phosphoribosyltransferase
MTHSDQHDMMKLILDSQALSIWNRETGQVYWYAAGTPGPFYLNTEIMLGKDFAAKLLVDITDSLAKEQTAQSRAERVTQHVRMAVAKNKTYQTIIEALAAKADETFPRDSYTVISGGERRDWLFSILLADALNKPHLYLFKNKSLHSEQPLPTGAKVLHVADLINNAASYFDAWLPILKNANAACIGTLSVNTRGADGVKRLRDAHYTVAALNHVDQAFFNDAATKGLIDAATRDELAVFFDSGPAWARRYLMDKPDLFKPETLDAKSHERMLSFFANDPWKLRGEFGVFFEKMGR